MKRFLKNSTLFFLIYLGVSLIISCFLPYHWGNPRYSVKIKHLKRNQGDKYDTYFFGSSRVYRHIDPSLFDSLVNATKGQNIHSFNLGAPGTFPPQSYFLYEQFLDSELSKGVKYCFLELMDVANIPDHIMHEEKTNYWLNGKDMSFVFQSVISDKNESAAQKFTQLSVYFKSYLERVLHLGHFSRQLTETNYYDPEYLGPSQNGHLPLEYEIETASNPALREALLERRQGLEKFPTALEQRKKRMIAAESKTLSNEYDRIHQQRILELIQKSRRSGIQLIFMFIAPKPNSAYRNVVDLKPHLPDDQLIEITPLKYPELFTIENAFDIGHFNTQGVRLFTSYLAEEFKEIRDID